MTVGLLTREELYERYGSPERIDSVALLEVLALFDLSGFPLDQVLAHRYSSVEAYEAFALANRERNHIQQNGIEQRGPIGTDSGVFGVLLISKTFPVRG